MGNIELQREHWIDNLKGFMLLLIVMGHMGPIPHIISFVFLQPICFTLQHFFI